jgi:cell division protein FtsA
MEVLGLVEAFAPGLSRGRLTDKDSMILSIRGALDEVGSQIGRSIEQAVAGISGIHFSRLQCQGTVSVKGQGLRQVSAHDMERAREAALLEAKIPQDRIIQNLECQGYGLDGQEGLRDPLGKTGQSLSARMLVITASYLAVEERIDCLLRAGLDIEDLVPDQVAAGYAVLRPEEKEGGVALLDMGAALTKLAVFSGGSLRHISTLPLGGDDLTRDLSFFLNASQSSAELVKRSFVSCGGGFNGLNGRNGLDGRGEGPEASFGRSGMETDMATMVGQILEDRTREITDFVWADISREGLDKEVRQVVLTGGGSLLEGWPELAQEMLKLPVRKAGPNCAGPWSERLSHPRYATGLGLALYGRSIREKSREIRGSHKGFGALLRKAVHFLKKEFSLNPE